MSTFQELFEFAARYSSGQKNVAVYVPFRLACTEYNNRSVALRFWYGTRCTDCYNRFLFGAGHSSTAPAHTYTWNLIIVCTLVFVKTGTEQVLL